MRSLWIAAGALALVTGVSSAQDPKPAAPPALRIGVKVTNSIDGTPEKVNHVQWFVWRQLHLFGARVDSLIPTQNAKTEQYIESINKTWAEKEPDAPPAAFIIEGSASSNYDNSEFFGQGQAHNFKGTLSLQVKTAEGEVLASFEWKHSWGRLPANYTQKQTLQEYTDMLWSTALIGVLNVPQIRERIPASKAKEVDTWIEKNIKRISEPLVKQNMADCDLQKFLESLKGGEDEDGDEDHDEGGKHDEGKDADDK
ncbi:MAG: hypothetical protein KDD82_03470 [Planctomycetes bacterium]|nr:hypothetical protein [Planctomycetota bacterium]